jgi:hypothetical protein
MSRALPSGRATRASTEPASGLGHSAGIPSAALIPADVLARRFANFAEGYREAAHLSPWWQRWRRSALLGAWAAMKLESEALERLTAQECCEMADAMLAERSKGGEA